MKWLGRISAKIILLFVAAANWGCSNGSGGNTNGSLIPATTLVERDANDKQSRLVQVASTSARAKRCGFAFDPDTLKGSYLAYEAKQGSSGEQVGIGNNYDSVVMSISKEVGANSRYCSDRETARIKAALQRHLAGDYTPDPPKPQSVASCPGCAPVVDEPFDPKQVWQSKRGRGY
jgi:hypothetical protein